MSDISNKRGDKMAQDNKPSDKQATKYTTGKTDPANMVSTPMGQTEKVIAGIAIVIVAIIAFFIVKSISGAGDIFNQPADNKTNNQPSTPTEQKEVKPEPTENTSDLDLSVFPRVLSLGLKNNESGELKNCEVQINPGTFNTGYSTRVPVIGSEEVNIPYEQFTKKSEKFDSDKYAVENIVVTMCSGQTSRIGIYGTN
jgi:cell division protein FtsL